MAFFLSADIISERNSNVPLRHDCRVICKIFYSYIAYMKINNDLKLSTVVVKNKELLETTVDDETILLSIAHSKYYGMDPVASRIWSLLQDPISIKEIIVTLLTEFDVSEDECEKDVFEFLENLVEEKMLDFPND